MFDLHYLTFWGIVIIATGTLLGTILIQRGNVLKSKESSTKLQEQLKQQSITIEKLNSSNNQIELQNKNLMKINEHQSEVLEAQSILLKDQKESIRNQTNMLDKQKDFLDKKELTNLYADYVQYIKLEGSYFDEINWMSKKEYSKEYFLKLSNSEYEDIEKKHRGAVYSILQSNLVVLNNLLSDLWEKKGFATYNYFEKFKLNEGTLLEENGMKILVDQNYKSAMYEKLNAYLKENNQKILQEVLEIKKRHEISEYYQKNIPVHLKK